MPLADLVVVAAAASVALAPLETGAASPATVARVPPKWSSQKVSLLRAVVVVVVVVVVEGSSTVSITDDGLSQLSDTFISLKKVFPKSTNHFFFNNSVAASHTDSNTMSLKLFITLALVGTAAAMCPSGCSGHGKCESSPKDSCTCRCTAKHYGS